VRREIQLSLGRISGQGEEEASILDEEAARQTMEYYLDAEAAARFIELLREGMIEIVRPEKPTPLASYILKLPPTRPWIPDLVSRIARQLEGYAFTVPELVDMLELSERTIESRLKEMRKPDYEEKRTVCFIDVVDEECRWALVRDLEEVSQLEEFQDSFKPPNLNEPVRVLIYSSQGGSARELILTPRILLERWDEIATGLPEEIYVMKVSPAYAAYSRDLSVTYYNLDKKTARLLILNAASLLQRRRAGYY
jgi:ATP-dependent Lhr-like helicase